MLRNTLIICLSVLGFSSFHTQGKAQSSEPIYNIAIESIDGNSMDLSQFKGKNILIVNVASKCGFTKQYEDLQSLYEKYKEDLVIIGVPCNQFGNQEPGSADEIKSFCKKNFGVTFPLAQKVNVKGKNQHALYHWLTSKDMNGVQDSNVRWNFHKYFINREGALVSDFGSGVNPMSEEITDLIK